MATPVRLEGLVPGARLPAVVSAAVRTPPGRLRLAGLVLAVLALGFGALTAWQVSERVQAADRVVKHSQRLSQDAAEIYRSLAAADTTAATGFLLAGDEPQAVRDQYQGDLTTASQLLTEAAALTTTASGSQHWVTQLAEQLPEYAGLVETARADNRIGLPLGAAYLRYASGQMQDQLLPTAQHLVKAEDQQLDRDHADATAPPWGAYGLALVALAALARYQVLLARRTNRVFNLGLVGATAALLGALAWLLVGGLSAAHALTVGRTAGALPLRALDLARTAVLQARTAENLDLVARGASTTYADQWKAVTAKLAGPGGELARARSIAPPQAAGALGQAQSLFAVWTARHQAAAASNTAGDYDTALKDTVSATGTDTSEAAFSALDQQLGRAADAEETRFQQAAGGVGGRFAVLAWGVAGLAVLAAVGVVRGIGRRVAEYR